MARTRNFICFLKQDLYWTLWFRWFIWCDIAPGHITIYMVHFTERRLSSIVQQSQDGTTLFSPGFAGKMLIVTKWPGDIIRQTDGLVCVEYQFHCHQLLVIPGGEWIVGIMREFMIINLRIYHQKCKLLICFEEGREEGGQEQRTGHRTGGTN